ncbi:aryl-sulfate sulfotransferase [Segetibacter aerophilus]|uniref:Thioredoxin n=1 Tax=Segetibacter aerophilus TaxID=670293 RepID=A0A512BDQ7_9BACT|nr:aryl-sulfate sulfotransferase [Segetibacter aerophilus]GEO10096.1 hypothetical protein SAE01_25920 [Segetibacter aerophilus]
MKKNYLLLALSVVFITQSFAQNGVSATDTSKKKPAAPADRNMFGLGIKRGLISNTDEATNGYILFPVTNSALVYLLNRKGEVVHEWKSNYGSLAPVAYLNNDGSIIQNVLDPDFPVFAGGGEAGRIEKITWDNKVVWDYEYANEEAHIHHDFTVMPNGHILAIAWEARTADAVIAAGRKPALTPKAGLWPDKIIEIEPQGERGGKIVWEWKIWDHLIQNLDAKKANFGNPADHPELLDFNAGEALPPPMTKDDFEMQKVQGRFWRNNTLDNLGSDVYHFNAIKYNPDLDQIAFSSPHLSEIFIIDHSTTTAQAASHKGGRWGKGGDFLYRWGNPEHYGRGDSTKRTLFGQHDIRWIEKGHPGAGHLMLFNNDISNRNNMNYSSIYEIVPPTDSKGNYLIEKGKPFGPEKPIWNYVAPDTVSFWSSFISGAHRLNNGNTFINEGAKGHYFEVTKDGKIVWDYFNPYRGNMQKPNGDPIPLVPLTYITFRSIFIPADHPGLANKKLEPLNPQPKTFVMPPPPGTASK